MRLKRKVKSVIYQQHKKEPPVELFLFLALRRLRAGPEQQGEQLG